MSRHGHDAAKLKQVRNEREASVNWLECYMEFVVVGRKGLKRLAETMPTLRFVLNGIAAKTSKE